MIIITLYWLFLSIHFIHFTKYQVFWTFLDSHIAWTSQEAHKFNERLINIIVFLVIVLWCPWFHTRTSCMLTLTDGPWWPETDDRPPDNHAGSSPSPLCAESTDGRTIQMARTNTTTAGIEAGLGGANGDIILTSVYRVVGGRSSSHTDVIHGCSGWCYRII